MKEVNKDSFLEEVIKNKGTVLVDFNAEWCGPCKMLKPIIEEVAEENKDVKVVSVNIDDEDELAEEYGVSSIPCLVIFKDGKEVDRSIGMKPKDAILEMIGD